MCETRSEEFARLVREYEESPHVAGKTEAWNLIADFAFDHADFIRDALIFYAKGDDLMAEVTAARETAAELTRLRSENAELVEALEPFANEADTWGRSVPGEAAVIVSGPACDHPVPSLFTVDDLRKARALLSRVSGGGK